MAVYYSPKQWDIIHSHKYGTVGKVVGIQNEIAQFGYKRGNTYITEVIQSSINSLKDLKSQLLAQELTFLKALFPNSSSNDPTELLKQVNGKLAEFQQLLPNFLRNSDLLNSLESLEWNSAIEKKLNSNLDLILWNLAKDETNKIKSAINPQALLWNVIAGLNLGITGAPQIRNFSATSIEDITSGEISFTSTSTNPNKIQGILQYLVMVKSDRKSGNSTGYEIKLSENIPANYRTRIQTAVDQVLGGKEIKKDEVNNKQYEHLLKKYVPVQLIPYFDFTSLTQNYVWGGSNNNKGALGEIYWKAALNYITGGKGAEKILSTGRWQTASKKQLPMDIFLEGLGAQVKNYHIVGSNTNNQVIYYPETSTKLNLFLQKIGFEKIAELDAFVTSWGYNKPNYECLPGKSNINYMGVYNRFSNIADSFNSQLQTLAETHLAELLSITQNMAFSGKVDKAIYGQIVGETQKTNTFYFFADKIVPASSLVDGIIDGLSTQTTADVELIRFSAEGIAPQETALVWPSLQPPTSNRAWEKNTVRYQIKINLTSILSRALR